MLNCWARRSCSFSILLANPAHSGVKHQEHRERDTDHSKRIERLMDLDFVQDDLGENRRCKRYQLYGERREEDVAPDALVLQQFEDEPGKAERCAAARNRIGIGGRFRLSREDDQFAGVARATILRRQRCSRHRTRFEHDDTPAIDLHDQR